MNWWNTAGAELNRGSGVSMHFPAGLWKTLKKAFLGLLQLVSRKPRLCISDDGKFRLDFFTILPVGARPLDQLSCSAHPIITIILQVGELETCAGGIRGLSGPAA
jgi:hypothetical protein